MLPPISAPDERFANRASQQPLIHSKSIPSSTGISSELTRRCIEIPKKTLDVTKDSQWLQALLEALSLASQVCTLVKTNTGMLAIPLLEILTAPLYLPQAFRSAYDRILMIRSAIKAHDFSMVFFGAARALDTIGSAAGTAIKSLSSSLKLVGAAKVFVGGFFCTFILPLLLIIIGAISAVAQGMSLVRAIRVLKEFEKRASIKDTKSVFQFLDYLQGPKQLASGDAKSEAQFEVNKQAFFDDHFANEERGALIQNQIGSVFKRHDFRVVSSARELLISREVQIIIDTHLKKTDPHHSAELANAFEFLKKGIRLTELEKKFKEGQELQLVEELLLISGALQGLWDTKDQADLFKASTNKIEMFKRLLQNDRQLQPCDLSLIHSFHKSLSDEIKNTVDLLVSKIGCCKLPNSEKVFFLLQKTRELSSILVQPLGGQECKLIDEMEALGDALSEFYYNKEYAHLWNAQLKITFKTSMRKIESAMEEIRDVKKSFLNEGEDTIALMRAELHRTIFNNALQLLIAVMILISGVISIATMKHQLISTAFSVSSSGLTIFSIFFDKKVSQKNFHAFHSKFR